MLGLNTIYTMESFNDMFPGGVALDGPFEQSSKSAHGLAKSAVENPTSDLPPTNDERPPDVVDEQEQGE